MSGTGPGGEQPGQQGQPGFGAPDPQGGQPGFGGPDPQGGQPGFGGPDPQGGQPGFGGPDPQGGQPGFGAPGRPEPHQQGWQAPGTPPPPPQGPYQPPQGPAGQPPYPAPPPGGPAPAQPPGVPYPAAPGPDARARRQRTIGWVAAAVAVALLATGAIVVLSGDGDDGGAQGIGAPDGAPAAPRLPGTGDSGGTGGDGGGDPAGSSGGGGSTGGGQDGPKDVVAPAHTTGTDGLVIAVGEQGNAHTLTLYEDMRCPSCAVFEQGVGDTVIKDIKAGKYKAEFKMATFLDGSFGGDGSKNALSALGAALNVSPDAFLEYKKALFSKEHHPQESSDQFASDDYLLKVAGEVPALKGNAGFAEDVTDGTYDGWAEAVGDAFSKTGVSAVPTVELDGRKVTSDGTGAPMSAAEYTEAVDKLL